MSNGAEQICARGDDRDEYNVCELYIIIENSTNLTLSSKLFVYIYTIINISTKTNHHKTFAAH